MKRLSILLISVLMTLNVITYGQDIFVGKLIEREAPIFSTKNPSENDSIILCLETIIGDYILSIDSEWIWDYSIGPYYSDAIVEISGVTSSAGIDIYSKEHFVLEIDTIYFPNLELFTGKIIVQETPIFSMDNPPEPCEALCLETALGNYYLSKGFEWICDSKISIAGVEYLLDDEIELRGHICSYLDIYSVEHQIVEIRTMKKLPESSGTFNGIITTITRPYNTVPQIPGMMIVGFSTNTNIYIITINSNAIGDGPFIFDDVKYFPGLEVEITGVVTTGIDLRYDEYSLLEIETITKVPTDIVGKIIEQEAPENSKNRETVLWLKAIENNFALSVDSNWIVDNHIIFIDDNGIEHIYYIGEFVEIRGIKDIVGTQPPSEFLLDIESIKYPDIETFRGEIAMAYPPDFEYTYVNYPILYLETVSEVYTLSLDFNWLPDSTIVIAGDEYGIGDEVEISGIASSARDWESKEQYNLEIKSIKKLPTEVESLSGIITQTPNPCETNPCQTGVVISYQTVDNEYILTVNSSWIWDENFTFEGINYFVGNDVEITGTTTSKIDINLREYTELEIETIKNVIGVELFSAENSKVYYNAINQTVTIEEISPNQIFAFELLDIAGKVVLRKTNIENNSSINAQKLTNGVYVYRLMQNNQIVNTGKLVINK